MKQVVVLGHHNQTNQYLTFVVEGTITSPATVNLSDPDLTLYVAEELIETGNSLSWMTPEQLESPSTTRLQFQ
ncbi:hypothetical protein ACFX4N_23875 [Priestia sp. YIM B13551]|uniref:hypothetical protein n=1 Tax=Priestia sp. YIM B13551 TaxID=3366306 RepID=UPI00366C7721